MAKPAERVKIRLKKNDLVEVIAGRDAGKRGKILMVLREKGRVIVQGVGFVKRHTRPRLPASVPAMTSTRSFFFKRIFMRTFMCPLLTTPPGPATRSS